MLNEKTADILVTFSYTCVIALHILYSLISFDTETSSYVILYSLIGSLIVFLTRRFNKNGKYKWLFKYGIEIITMVSLSCILGYLLHLIAYIPIIYFLICIEYSAYSDSRINLECAIFSHFGIFFAYFFTRDIIENTAGVPYFLIMCGYLEIIFIFEFFAVSFSQRRHKELNEQHESLIKIQKSKDDFFANMSHEIRTPLNVVIGMCELLLREENLEENQRDYGENIRSAGQNLLYIVNDILDFSKIGSGKMELIEEPYSIRTMLQDIINLAVTKNTSKHLELIFDCNPNIPTLLFGDEARIRQIITNLVTNAIKYTPSGTVYIHIDSHPTSYGMNLHINVHDTGIGIKEENIDLIFGAFNQVDTKRNRHIEGTGLGLPIAKQMTNAMGGFIHAKSKYGLGSDFFVTIPQKIVDSTPLIHLDKEKHFHILFCFSPEKEIHEKELPYYQKLLNHLKQEVSIQITYCSGIEAIESLLKTHKITHVVVDSLYASYPAYFIKIAKKIPVIRLYEQGDKLIKLPGIIYLQKPIYSLAFLSILNGESSFANSKEHTEFSTTLRMPNAKLLIVDDNAMNLKVVEGLLKPYQLHIDTATSGQQAIQALQTVKYDIVFMDHMMPEMDGIETTKRIRKQPEEYYQKVPIIAFSANALNGAKEYFLSQGFQDFISKPVENTALERVLRTWIPQTLQEIINDTNASAPKIIPSKSAQKNMELDIEFLRKQSIDIDTALSYCNHSLEQYSLLALMFCENYQTHKNTLQTHKDTGDLKNYRISVHSLKTNARTLGANTLFDISYQHELAANEKNSIYLSEHWNELMEEWEHIYNIFSENIK